MAVGIAAATKVCTGCRVEKPNEGFSIRNSSRISRCADCIAEANREWRKANPDRYTKQKRLAHLSIIGLTVEQFDAMLTKQGGRCAICRTDQPGGMGGSWHADHDHACCPGKRMCADCFRGILCAHCNMGMGQFGDSPANLIAAADYLIGDRS